MSVIPLTEIEATPAGYYFTINGRPATILPDFDVETFSMAGFIWNASDEGWEAPEGIDAKKKGLPSVGVVVYAEHPSFRIMCLAYDLKDGKGRRRWRDNDPLPPLELIEYLRKGGIVEAHNAAFERRAWNAFAVRHWGAAPLKIEQQRCSLAKARAAGWPPSLGNLADAMGTTPKDKRGDGLIRLLSVPQKPSKRQPNFIITRDQAPSEFQALEDYNEADIVAEAHASAHIPDLSPQEQEYWFIDQRINERGVAVDVATLDAAASILRQAEERYAAQFRSITDGLNPTQLQKFGEWCESLGFPLDNMREETIETALQSGNPPELVRQALLIRQALGSASVKKVHAMRAMIAKDGRLHDLFNFHGAHTGRPTGEGPQPTNLPKAGPDVWRCACGRYYGHTRSFCAWCGQSATGRRKRAKVGDSYQWVPAPPTAKPDQWNPEAMEDAIEIIRSGSLSMLEMFFGEALSTIGGCLRGTFVAAPGHELISSDWTSIEAVVLACLAGEQWRIDLFRNREKIYEKSGALVFGVPYEEVLEYARAYGEHHLARQVGKTAELALGYRGWIHAWRAFDPDGAHSDEELKDIILKWRAASPAIVEFWGGQSRRNYGKLIWERYGVEGAFIEAALTQERPVSFRDLVFTSYRQFDRLTVVITLPSGRTITYNNVYLSRSDRYGNEYDIFYDRWNTNPKNGARGWTTVSTHGGKLTENIVQAVANDILRAATMECEREGKYPIVLHIYDELVAEVPQGTGSVEELEEIMARTLPWMRLPDGTPWPVRADGGWRGYRYRKG